MKAKPSKTAMMSPHYAGMSKPIYEDQSAESPGEMPHADKGEQANPLYIANTSRGYKEYR